MGEEDVKTDDVKTDDPDKKQSDLSQIELVAQKIGWNPDFEGENPIDAETFILNSKEINQNMSKKLRNVTREMEEMRRQVEFIAENSKRSVQKEVEDTQSKIEELNKKRMAAVEEGDAAAFNEYDAEVKKLTKKVDEAANIPQPQGKTPEYIAWVESGNQWYENDEQMRVWANTYYENGMPASLKAAPREKFLKHIAEEARKVFPEKFENEAPAKTEQKKETKTTKVSDVAAPSRKTGGAKNKYTFNDLTYPQKKTAESMVKLLKGTPMEKTLDQYAHELLSESEGE